MVEFSGARRTALARRLATARRNGGTVGTDLTVDRADVRSEVDAASIRRGLELAGQVLDHGPEVEALLPHRPGPVTGVEEEIVHEGRNALRGTTDHHTGSPKLIGRGVRILESHVDVGSHDGKRVPELVGGLVDELAL